LRLAHLNLVELPQRGSLLSRSGRQEMGQTAAVHCRTDCRAPPRCEAIAQDCIQDLNPSLAEPSPESKLIRAARDGNLEVVTQQIKMGADVNSRQPLKLITLDRYHSGQPIRNCGLTVLMYAAKTGSLKVVTTLINAKARVNDTDERGVSALHFAAASGDFPTFQVLLDHHASPSTTEEGDSVLDYLPQDVRSDSTLLRKFVQSIPAGDEDDCVVAHEAKKGRRPKH